MRKKFEIRGVAIKLTNAVGIYGSTIFVGAISPLKHPRIKFLYAAGPSEGLKIWGCQYYLVGIICPPWLR